MAALTPVNPAWVRNTGGAFLERKTHLVDGEAVWYAGAFLKQKIADGLLYEASTSAASGVAADAITHIALSDLTAQTVDTTLVEVGVVTAEDIFEINSKSAAVTRASNGASYGLDVTSHLHTIDTTNATHRVLRVVQPTWAERDFQDNSADTLARVMVRVLAAAIDAQAA